MQLVFSGEAAPTNYSKSIFLAGPIDNTSKGNLIPRDWRKDVIELLEQKGYDGVVFIPISKAFWEETYAPIDFVYSEAVVEWECMMMDRADILLFWVNRDKEADRYGLTTNVEFGRYLNTGRIVYGHTKESFSVFNLDTIAAKNNIKVHNELPELVDTALSVIGDGAYRDGGETLCPLNLWRLQSVRDWFNCNKGNVTKFVTKSVVPMGDNYHKAFAFSAHVAVKIPSEDRVKECEYIFGRTKTSYTVPYFDHPDGKRYFVLVSEFRSTVSKNKGFIIEFPGGSAEKEGVDPLVNAAKELSEEIGVSITDSTRLKPLRTSQTNAVFNVTQTHLYELELTEEEFRAVNAFANKKKELGEDDEERITLSIHTFESLLTTDTDLATIGMAACVGNRKEVTKPAIENFNW